jgi:hypothetical protein
MKAMKGAARVYSVRPPNLFQFGVNAVTIAFALALVAVFSIIIWRRRSLEAGVAAAVVGSFLIAPHTAIYDLLLLLVALPALPLTSFATSIRYALLTPLPYWAALWETPWSTALRLMLLGGCCPYISSRTSRCTSPPIQPRAYTIPPDPWPPTCTNL